MNMGIEPAAKAAPLPDEKRSLGYPAENNLRGNGLDGRGSGGQSPSPPPSFAPSELRMVPPQHEVRRRAPPSSFLRTLARMGFRHSHRRRGEPMTDHRIPDLPNRPPTPGHPWNPLRAHPAIIP
jgi:hypothetical protein